MIEREKYLMAQRDGFIKQIQKWTILRQTSLAL
jgi:hypothetical protein